MVRLSIDQARPHERQRYHGRHEQGCDNGREQGDAGLSVHVAGMGRGLAGCLTDILNQSVATDSPGRFVRAPVKEGAL